MAGATDQPLSIEEAKTRLRTTAEEAMPIGYIKRHPYKVLSIALSAGFLFGRNRLSGNLFTIPMLNALWSINKFFQLTKPVLRGPLGRNRP